MGSVHMPMARAAQFGVVLAVGGMGFRVPQEGVIRTTFSTALLASASLRIAGTQKIVGGLRVCGHGHGHSLSQVEDETWLWAAAQRPRDRRSPSRARSPDDARPHNLSGYPQLTGYVRVPVACLDGGEQCPPVCLVGASAGCVGFAERGERVRHRPG